MHCCLFASLPVPDIFSLLFNQCQTGRNVLSFFFFEKKIIHNPHTGAQQDHISTLQLTCHPPLATLCNCCQRQ